MKRHHLQTGLWLCSLLGLSLGITACDRDYDFVGGLQSLEPGQNIASPEPIATPTPEPILEEEEDRGINICNPFSNPHEGCVPGLRGRVTYLDEDMPRYQNVNDYLDFGIQAPNQVFMSELFIPTRAFSDGFRLSDGNLLKDSKGEPVLEYFALELSTFLALTEEQEEGLYQFALLSDDGSILEISEDGVSWSEFLNNDGYQAARLGCDLQGLELTRDQAVGMRIKWFQGPRDNLALTMLWRKVDPTEGPIEDELCGYMSLTQYFGPDFSNPDFENYRFGDLLRRGWAVVPAENFILPRFGGL